MRNEITDLLLEELDRYGLKGEISDRSKHLEVAWQTPQGRRFVIVPRTPSDWRGGMNVRSDMRKLLRADNLQPKQEQVTSFQRAMSLPKEPLVNQVARDRALHRDIETLSELVFELLEQNSILQQKFDSLLEKMNSVSVVSTVKSVVGFVGQQPIEAPIVKPLPKTERVTSTEVVYNCIAYEWTPRTEIIERSGLSKTVTNQCFVRLQRRGLIERGLRGMWRKKPT